MALYDNPAETYERVFMTPPRPPKPRVVCECANCGSPLTTEDYAFKIYGTDIYYCEDCVRHVDLMLED